MGLFDKLFGKKANLSSKQEVAALKMKTKGLQKTSTLLDEDLYWSIVEKSINATNNQEDQEQFLLHKLSELSPEEIIGFRLYTDKLLFDTYNSNMWCAGYIMNEGCSDDSFEYFRNWVISRGKDTYMKAKENPDSLVNEIDESLDFYEFESFWFVALDAFKKKTGNDLYNYVDYDSFKMCEGNYPEFEFTWEEDNPESMKNICPELCEKWNV